MADGATGVVDIGSDLERKSWMVEGLIQERAKSFWAAYTGDRNSVIYQKNNETASNGHTIVFDYRGNLAGKAVKDKDTAYGKGEQKKKFSNKITVARYRLVADNGDAFDGVNIGDLSITQHSDSRTELSDLFIRWKDQMIFDTAQSYYLGENGLAPKHGIYYDASSTKISYQTLVEIEKVLKTGTGYVSGSNPLGYSVRTTPATAAVKSAVRRAPLRPFRLKNGKSVWLMVIDAFTKANLMGNTTNNTGLITLAQHADVRGENNLVFHGVIGYVGQLMIVEAETFFGSNASTGLENTSVEVCGLRQYDTSESAWSGEDSFLNPEYSRNLILGEGAMQLGFGKMPDYKWQPSQDFGIKSESAVEFWTECQKTYLMAENNDDYKMAKIASMDHAIIPFDVKL